MKTKIFGILLLLGLSFEAFSQSRSSGRTTLRDGTSIVRIEVGTSDRDQAIRIRNLEQAVRDLQYRIYDLELNDSVNRTRTVEMYVCSLKTSFNGVFVGKATTQTEAQAQAINSCQRAKASFCTSTRVDCERTVEQIRY